MTVPTTDLLSVRDAARHRRSIRTYRDEPIPREDLEDILAEVSLAPSAFNAQPWRFIVVESADVREQLASAAHNQRQVRSAPAVIVLYTDMADTLGTVDEILHPGMDDAKRDSARSAFLRIFGQQSEADREAWGASQGHIALGYLLLAAAAHGYETSPMAGFDAERVKALLNLPANARVPAIVAIGHGAEEGFSHHRHPVDRIASFV